VKKTLPILFISLVFAVDGSAQTPARDPIQVAQAVGVTVGAAGGAYLTMGALGTGAGAIWADLDAGTSPQGRPAPAVPVPDPNAPHSVAPPGARPPDGPGEPG